MVGRELHTICPNGEDHQGASMRGGGGREPGTPGNGSNMIDLRKSKATGMILGNTSTFAHICRQDNLLVMRFASPGQTLVFRPDIQNATNTLTIRTFRMTT